MKAVKTVCSIILLMGSILSSHSMVGTFDVNSYELCSVTASSRVWLKGVCQLRKSVAFHNRSPFSRKSVL